ncbi:unnamed protein product, partial [Iphiclides podalirius]
MLPQKVGVVRDTVSRLGAQASDRSRRASMAAGSEIAVTRGPARYEDVGPLGCAISGRSARPPMLRIAEAEYDLSEMRPGTDLALAVIGTRRFLSASVWERAYAD